MKTKFLFILLLVVSSLTGQVNNAEIDSIKITAIDTTTAILIKFMNDKDVNKN